MTREEAIKELKILREDYWEDDGYGHETIQNDDTMFALDMAIRSLEGWEKVKTKIEEAQSSIFCTEDENTGLEIALILIDNQISEVENEKT